MSAPAPVSAPGSAQVPAGDTAPSRLTRVLLRLVGLYRATAAIRAPRCRFHPTCSQYAVTALEDHGAARGTWLAVRRIARCHPFHPGGVDHVPARAPRPTP